ncbi:hypothetical protein NEOKW01_0773 [Nematocida sp. AWRm80]|nr:hypothetical protein NEOKW01_0773 [Nematocida sp. AWRm80]
MKKKQNISTIDLFRDIPVASVSAVQRILKECTNLVTKYNELMIMYEEKKQDVSHIFMLMKNTDPSVFQHIPVFCMYYNINLYKVTDEVPGSKVPYLICIRKTDPISSQIIEILTNDVSE